MEDNYGFRQTEDRGFFFHFIVENHCEKGEFMLLFWFVVKAKRMEILAAFLTSGFVFIQYRH